MLEDKVALVTGGSSGLGRAVAVELARRNFRIAIAARHETSLAEAAAEIGQHGGRVLAIQTDVTDRSAVERMVAVAEGELGAIDVLVNSAGVNHAIGELAKVDPDDWWREVEINLRGPALCARAVLPGMIARKSGRIINMASMAGVQALETLSMYCVSKAALIRLSEVLALETRRHGIAVFAVHPGTVRTPMNDYIANAEAVGRDARYVQQYIRHLYDTGSATPIGKSLDVVCAIALGRVDALSGCFLDVDDNLDELLPRADEIRSKGQLRLGLVK